MSIALREGYLSLSRRAFDLLPWVYMLFGIFGFISTVAAVGQWLGWQPWPTYGDKPTGLFFSPITAGAFLGLTIVGLVIARWWEPIPVLVVGLLLAGSRGGFAVVGVGLLAHWVRKPLVILVLILLGAFAVTWSPSASDMERLLIWQAGFVNLTWFGHGWGSFNDVWIIRDNLGYHPQFAHNDYLQLAFELGLYSVPIFCVIAYALSRTSSREWPLLVAFCALATFSFPSYIPATAGIGLLALASCLRGKYEH